MKTIVLTKLEELKDLGSALTIEGLAEDYIWQFFDWIKKYTPMKQEIAYIIKGKTMNKIYGLTGNNAYGDDITLVAIKLEDMEDWSKIMFSRFEIGARWFDDIVMNNEMREIEK